MFCSKKIAFPALFIFLAAFFARAQEALKSTEEEYYNFLSLTGAAERPSLNYRTLSDSEWIVSDENQNIWAKNNLGSKRTLYESNSEGENWFTRGIEKSVKLKLYGPEWFNSYNTKAPYGQNDGALWQGKGYNTSLTAGARLEAYGLELTLKPQASWSENREFEYTTPNYFGENFSGKAEKYGYYGVVSIDAPQRFGDSSFWTFDWGDTEIRYSWRTFSAGFGTQTIWLGPAQLNPIIHSNNAASYPKFDIGIRKTSVYLPHFKWHLGEFELRGWWGKLTESDWFDNDDSNDNNLISGFCFAYAFPGIFKGLTLGFNRTVLSKWNELRAYSLFENYNFGMTSARENESDSRVSFTMDWLFTKTGLDIYIEWARNDYSPNTDYILRYPFHTQGWTGGIQKAFNISDSLKIKLLLEITVLECSDDYERVIDWYSSFYAHHQITQGYTNRGQWLGAGIGTGGNSQYLGVSFIHRNGDILFFIQRRNPDLDYTFHIQCKTEDREETSIRAMLDFGIGSTYFITKNIRLNAAAVFTDEHNPTNEGKANSSQSKHRYNFNFTLGAKYIF